MSEHKLNLHHLPQELLEHIVFFLDVDPPSVTQNAQEPTLKALFEDLIPLKNLSLVSKSWKTLIDPLIFRYLRLSVADLQNLAAFEQDQLEQRKAKQAERVSNWQTRQWTDPRTHAVFTASMKALSSDTVLLEKPDGTDVALTYSDLAAADEHYVSLMANHVSDQLRPPPPAKMTDETVRALRLKLFLQRRAATAKSMVVYAASPHEKHFDVAGHHVWQRARIWELTKKFLNPARLVLVAPPELLAKLAHCFTNVSDLWSFHIPYQRIELQQTPAPHVSDQRRLNYEDAAEEADGFGLLHSRYWRSFEYDEGSSLNIYGTYHYFEKRPPSIINLSSLQVHGLGAWLAEFTYTSVFPHFVHFGHVLDTIAGFKALMHLRLKIAPDRHSTLLDDEATVTRGNLRLGDCWQELERCYEDCVTRLLRTDSANGLPILERFTSMDYQNAWLEEKLDSLREMLLPEWSKERDGSWVPLVKRPVFRNWCGDGSSEATASSG